jgi:hypothetical protein
LESRVARTESVELDSLAAYSAILAAMNSVNSSGSVVPATPAPVATGDDATEVKSVRSGTIADAIHGLLMY